MLMSKTVEKKKKVYKLATELNISHETLLEFLRKKGHEVKSHMSTVDDDMMRDVLVHFKKEKDVAEKHQRKIQEIRDSRKKAEKKEEVVEQQVVAHPVVAPAPPPAVVEEPPVEVAAEEEPEVVESAPADEPVVEPVVAQQDQGPAAPVQEPSSTDAPAVETPPVAPVPVEATAQPAAPAPPRKQEPEYLSPLEKERRTRVGLTIKGKMDLRPKQAPPKPAKPEA